MNVVIDSSIFVEAVTNSVHQKLCLDLLRAIYINPNIQIFEPVLLMYEVIVASMKTTGNSHERSKDDRLKQIDNIINSFKSRKNFNIIDMDYDSWLKWYKTKDDRNSHKSQDEIFMSTAFNNEAVLLTLDHDMINNPDCLSGKCNVLSPYDGLKIIEKI